MITAEEAVKLIVNYDKNSDAFYFLLNAPFCCDQFLYALYDEVILNQDGSVFELEDISGDNWPIKFCPFCGKGLL